jgi:hypothetical protein
MDTALSVCSNILVLELSSCPFVRPDPGFLGRPDDRLEVRKQSVGHLVPGVFQCVATQPRRVPVLCQRDADGVRERRWLAGVDQDAQVWPRDDLGHAPGAVGHHRCGAGHGLEDDVGPAFLFAGQAKHVGCRVPGVQVGVQHGAGPDDVFGDPKFRRQGAQVGFTVAFLAALPDDDEAQIRVPCGAQHGVGAQQDVHALAWHQVRYRQHVAPVGAQAQRRAGVRLCCGVKPRRVHAIGGRMALVWRRAQPDGPVDQCPGDTEVARAVAQREQHLPDPHGKPGKVIDVVAAQGDDIRRADNAGQQGARKPFRERQVTVEHVDLALEAMGPNEPPQRKGQEDALQRLEHRRNRKELRKVGRIGVGVGLRCDLVPVGIARKVLLAREPRDGRDHDQIHLAGQRVQSLLDELGMHRHPWIGKHGCDTKDADAVVHKMLIDRP